MDHSNHDMSGHMGHGDHDMDGHNHHDNHGSDHMGHGDHMDHSGHNMNVDVMHSVVNATLTAVADGIQSMGGSQQDIGSMADMHSHHHARMDHDMGHMDMENGSMDHGMSMSFHFGYTETILFDWWTIDNIGGLIGSMVGIFLLSMLYEGLKYWREHLFRKSIASMQYCATIAKGNNIDNKAVQYMEQIISPPRMNMMSLDHFIQTMMHMLQMIISYFLMLIFMTYNVWLCLATVLGAGCGYFLFGWRKSVVVDITEHCH